MQKVLVTGSNGFVSRYIVSALLQQGYSVLATARSENNFPFDAANFSFEQMNFTEEQQVKTVFEKVKPAIVIHCGAMSKPDECELNKEAALLTNVEGTRLLLQYAEACKAHFIFLSTDFVFDGSKAMHTEDEVPAAVNFYGHTKLLGESLLQQYRFGHTIVRTVLVYGNANGSRDNLVTLTAKKLKNGELFKVVDDQQRTPTLVNDLAEAIVKIADKRATGIFHICGAEMMSPFDMALATATFLQLDTTLLQKVNAAIFKEVAKRPALSGFSIAKAKNELGFMPHRFSEGLAITFG